jgi:hypothetical protein
MTSPLTLALGAGFAALQSSNGEPLLFRDSIVTAVVNRDPQDRVVRTPDFDPRDSSEIRLMTSAVVGIPRPGEEFADDYGMSHRVQTVKMLGQFYTCHCLPNEPVPELLANEVPDMLITDDLVAMQAA